jgi:hypothetical protein
VSELRNITPGNSKVKPEEEVEEEEPPGKLTLFIRTLNSSPELMRKWTSAKSTD